MEDNFDITNPGIEIFYQQKSPLKKITIPNSTTSQQQQTQNSVRPRSERKKQESDDEDDKT